MMSNHGIFYNHHHHLFERRQLLVHRPLKTPRRRQDAIAVRVFVMRTAGLSILVFRTFGLQKPYSCLGFPAHPLGVQLPGTSCLASQLALSRRGGRAAEPNAHTRSGAVIWNASNPVRSPLGRPPGRFDQSPMDTPRTGGAGPAALVAARSASAARRGDMDIGAPPVGVPGCALVYSPRASRHAVTGVRPRRPLLGPACGGTGAQLGS